MMNAVKHIDKLIENGFTPQQAKGSVDTTVEIMNENLASKEDLKEVVHKIELMESRLTIKLGKIVFTGISVLGIILGILIKS